MARFWEEPWLSQGRDRLCRQVSRWGRPWMPPMRETAQTWSGRRSVSKWADLCWVRSTPVTNKIQLRFNSFAAPEWRIGVLLRTWIRQMSPFPLHRVYLVPFCDLATESLVVHSWDHRGALPSRGCGWPWQRVGGRRLHCRSQEQKPQRFYTLSILFSTLLQQPWKGKSNAKVYTCDIKYTWGGSRTHWREKASQSIEQSVAPKRSGPHPTRRGRWSSLSEYPQGPKSHWKMWTWGLQTSCRPGERSLKCKRIITKCIRGAVKKIRPNLGFCPKGGEESWSLTQKNCPDGL